MLIFWHFSGIASLVNARYCTYSKRCKQREQFTTGLICSWSEYIANTPEFLVLQHTRASVLVLYCQQSSIAHQVHKIRAISACTIGEEVIRLGESFKVRITALILILSLLAVSRTLALLNAIQVICALTSGLRTSQV